MATIEELVVKIKADTANLQSGLSSVNSKLSQTEKNARKVSLAFKAIPVLALALALKKVVSELTMTAKQLDIMSSKMKSATGSSEGMRQGLEFVREEANRLGLDLVTSTSAFASLAAAGLRAGISFETIKETFSAVAEASTALNLSVDEQKSVFMALSQIASKGVVSMEELRQQLGERLPVAFSAAAKGLGITQMELNKLVSSGKLMATEFFPAFARGLREDMGEAAVDAADGLTQQINRMGNAFFELRKSVVESGAGEAIKFTVGFVTQLTEELTNFLNATDNEKLASLTNEMQELALSVQEAKASMAEGGLFSDDEGDVTEAVERLREVRNEYALLMEEIAQRKEEAKEDVGGMFGLTPDVEKQKEAFELMKSQLQDFVDFEIKTTEDGAKAEKKIRKDVDKFMTNSRKSATNDALSIMRNLGRENKAFAIAEILLRKGIAISESIINTQVAVTRALALDPTGILAAKVQLQGNLATGLIAATGVAELAGVSGGGSGGSDFGGTSSVDSSGNVSDQPAAQVTQVTNINVDEDSLISPAKLIAILNQGIEDGNKILLNGVAV